MQSSPLQFNESHIPGSPFPFLVGKMGADPALVTASGKGLTEGECGKIYMKMSMFSKHFIYVEYM